MLIARLDELADQGSVGERENRVLHENTCHWKLIAAAGEMTVQWNPSNTDTLRPPKCREVSSFQGANNTYLYEVGTWSSVLIRETSLRGVL